MLLIAGDWSSGILYFQSCLLEDRCLIVARDFNFMMSLEEVWGFGKSEDPLSYYFKTKFEEMKLIDIAPNVLTPTLSNGRCGDVGITKRLDRFFLWLRTRVRNLVSTDIGLIQ